LKKTPCHLIRKPISILSVGRLLVIILLQFVWISNSYAVETPDAPDGYSWKQVEEIKAAFLVPNTWHFSNKQTGNHNTYSISKEQVDDSGSAPTGLTVVVRREGSGKDSNGVIPSEFAAVMLEEIQKSRELERSHVGKQGPFETFRFQYVRDVEGKETFREYNLFIANDTTGTLYLIAFSAPLAEWDSVWKIGEVILQNMIIDDEI